MELKTLKDVDISFVNDCPDCRETLKEEAIKWLEFFDKAKNDAGAQAILAYDYKLTDVGGIMRWIRIFFDIEEDSNDTKKANR